MGKTPAPSFRVVQDVDDSGSRYDDVIRTTLSIDDDVLAQARDLAASGRRPLGVVISDLARRSLRPVGISDSYDFPVFDVPPDAPPITAADVAQALDDE